MHICCLISFAHADLCYACLHLEDSASLTSNISAHCFSFNLYTVSYGLTLVSYVCWLPVHRGVDFKISTLVYRLMGGTAPVYLADKCTLVTAACLHPLWSADNRMCLVKRSRNQFGDCCFATAEPML